MRPYLQVLLLLHDRRRLQDLVEEVSDDVADHSIRRRPVRRLLCELLVRHRRVLAQLAHLWLVLGNRGCRHLRLRLAHFVLVLVHRFLQEDLQRSSLGQGYRWTQAHYRAQEEELDFSLA